MRNKQMLERVLHNGFKDLHVNERMLHTVSDIGRVKIMIPRWRKIVILVTLLLAMATVSFAATRPAVLNWLLGYAPAGEMLASAVQEVKGEAQADQLMVRVTSAVVGGGQLAFSYEIENERPQEPVLVMAKKQMMLGDMEAELEHSRIWMVPSPHLDVLPVERNPVAGGAKTYCADQVLKGQIACQVVFQIYRPAKGFAVVDDAVYQDLAGLDETYRAELQDRLDTLKGFANTLIAPQGAKVETWQAQGYTVIDASGGLAYSVDDPRAHLRAGAQIPVSFVVDASECQGWKLSAINEREDCQVVAELQLSVLGTAVDVQLIPAENTQEAARALADKHGVYHLTDEHGADVRYSDMDTLYSLLPYVTKMNEQWVCRYLADRPGLQAFPQSIGFMTQAGELFRLSLPAE